MRQSIAGIQIPLLVPSDRYNNTDQTGLRAVVRPWPLPECHCLSVNDAVLHGLPHDYVLRDGDLLTMNFAVSIDGWAADSAVSVFVGDAADAADRALVDSTRRALAAGIAAAVPGKPGRGLVLRPGMTVALEPWWARGGNRLAADADGWTLRMADGSNAAHSEHTIAITDHGARVLTAGEEGRAI